MSDTRLLQYFDALADLDADARAARLHALAADDPALAAALRRMLAADSGGAGLLDGALADAVPPEAVSADRSGQDLGPWHLAERIGRGGMGEVYRAQRRDGGYAQTVALKLLRRGLDSEDVLGRFAQERRILARLEHPGIARLIDGGMSADGLPWLAMELVEGQPLTRYAEHRALGLRARVQLLLQVCEALDYAHRRLVIHRDLKPSNVLVAGDGSAKLLDFGIAKLLDQPEGEALTGTGVRVLSPAYAAPEQLAGEPVGIATDVYALGLLLYELLTGELPHGRRGGALAELSRDLAAEPERPSANLRRRTGSGGTLSARMLEGDLDTVVLKALAAEPDRRYASAAALAEDLRRWLDGRPIAARPDTLSYRLGKFVRRHRGGVLASLATLVALVAALGIALWQAREAQQQAERAEREAANAREMTQRARRVKDFLISVFAQEDPIRRDARGPLTMQDAFEDALRRIDTEMADDPALQGDLLDDFGEIVTSKGDFVRAQGMLDRALALAESSRGPDDPAVAEALVNLAALNSYRGEVAAAKPLLVRAVAILEPRVGEDPASLANAVMSLAAVLRNEGDLAGAIAHTQRAIDLFTAADPEGQGLLVAMQNLAVMYLDRGDYAESERRVREAMALVEARHGPDAPGLINLLATLESIADQQGKPEEEKALGERRLAIARKAFPGDHPWTAAALTETGWFLARDGDHAAGEARIAESIAMYERLGGLDVDAISAYRRLAMSQNRRKDAAAASATMGTAAALCRQSAMVGNLLCLVVRANAIQLSAPLAATPEMVAEAQAIADILAANFGPRIDEVAQALEAKATAQWALKQGAAARATQNEALAIFREVYGTDHEQVRRAQKRLDAMAEPASRT